LNRDASAKQRSGRFEIERLRQRQGKGPIATDPIGETAVPMHDRALLLRAKIVVAGPALMAEHAARRLPAQANPLAHLQVFHLRPSRGDGACDLVAWHQREGAKSPGVVDHRDVGLTDAAIVHGDLDLFGT
jgi:hypothetical protein